MTTPTSLPAWFRRTPTTEDRAVRLAALRLRRGDTVGALRLLEATARTPR